MTKKEKIEKCRSILYGNEVNSQLLADDEDFLMREVFVNHCRWNEKSRKEIKNVSVGRSAFMYGGLCFYLNYIDGTSDDISFMKCINGSDTDRKKISLAIRRLIEPQLWEMRKSINLPFKCPITHDLIYDIHNIHVDHYDVTFERMVSMLCDEFGESNIVSHILHNGQTYVFDNNLTKDFIIDFHNKNTHLRLVSKKANLSTLRKRK